MNAALLVLAGAWIICQVTIGHALQRLGIVS